ncbi:CHAT domain-containing tetratricopeptide repeat protein [Kamptonema sp. UHCC 0994]|uniref:CHAT domain-containing protein n=1 Tax=Kamptonema sp. UHCC 0994 TaxID=3031329 RepID=UPI0023B9A078|nr:CHAT domain-containing tetratricopeptide repeat protein [Kamptonema sp. UHCC 0994]MDF0553614.1 CHAT domain-containing protein [Kamptonema sp. UHCC 0994]
MKFFNWLQNLVKKTPSEKENVANLTPEQYQIYQEVICKYFLWQVFQTIEDCQGNSQIVHSLLAKNIDKLNSNYFNDIFQVLVMEILTEIKEKHRQVTTASVLANFSYHIQRFQLGNSAINIEIAIKGYYIALIFLTRESYPQDWARIQQHLATAYSKRIEELESSNVEQTICCYQSALEVFTHDQFPEEWASTQNNLGCAYLRRIKGERVDNIELAIKCWEATLPIRTREVMPQQWATTQNNLASAYYQRFLGQREDNIEQTIKYYEAALPACEAYPEDWAMTQHNLGIAYSERIQGESEKNLAQAIKCYEAAFQVRTCKAFPQQWANTFSEMGTTYQQLGEIETAIDCYQKALQVLTRESYPQQWANTYTNLATAYKNQSCGSKIENIEQAINYYLDTLQVYTRKAYPEDWARTYMLLGFAYAEVLQIKLQTMENIQIIDIERILNVEIKSFLAALEIYTPQSFPIQCLKLQRILGDVAFASEKWTTAMYSYSNAIAAVEQSREWATNEAARQEIQLNAIDVYIKMVQACINDGQIEKALETVERSKSRNLVELLANSELEPKNADDSLKQELLNLRRNISSIQLSLAQRDNNSTFNRDSFQGFRSSETSSYNREYIAQQREELQEYQRQLDEVFAQCQQLDPAFTLTQKVNHITVAEIRDLIDSHTAILEWYIGTDSFQIFIVTQSSLEVVQFDKAELEKLEAWNQQYLEALFNNTKTWRKNLSEWLNSLSQILRLDEILNHPALANCDSLILVPHRYLHLFPLHALSVSQQTWKRFNQETPHLQPPANPCLLDCFKKGVRYAPSCQLLQRVQQRERPPADTRTLFAIQNPTEDLAYTDIEVEVIKRDFTPADILSKQQATKTALLDNLETIAQAHYVHFSCHGSFDFQTPLISSLILAGAMESTDSPTLTGQKSLRLRSGGQANPAKCLTLQDIFATLNLPKCRLVTLSACETGLTDTTKQSDDCIGLATGFLYAGSQGVLSSLWSVDELATAFLMIKFYENLATADMAVALNTAQLWLRDVTKSELLEWIGELKLDSKLPQSFEDLCKKSKPDKKIFKSQFYWAAFCAIGN